MAREQFGSDNFGGHQAGTEFGRTMGKAADSMKSVADDTLGAAKAAGEHALDVAKDSAEDVKRFAEEKSDALLAWVKERPITSALIGVAAGCILVALLRKK